MPYIETVNRPSLFYRDWGAGRPVLFCSAWALSGLEFQYQTMTTTRSPTISPR